MGCVVYLRLGRIKETIDFFYLDITRGHITNKVTDEEAVIFFIEDVIGDSIRDLVELEYDDTEDALLTISHQIIYIPTLNDFIKRCEVGDYPVTCENIDINSTFYANETGKGYN